MGDFSVSDPVEAMELGCLHGNPGISGLNEFSKKSVNAVIIEQSFGWNINVRIFEDEIMNYL